MTGRVSIRSLSRLFLGSSRVVYPETSGDTLFVVKFYFKGQVVHETGFSNMKYAVMLLAGEWVRAQEPISEKVIEIEKTACDQVGCPDKAKAVYLMKKVTSLQGEYLDHGEYSSFTNYRKFCEEHSHRGDSSREDCDENYSTVELIPEGK